MAFDLFVSDDDAHAPENKKLAPSGGFDGPVSNRKCTDVLFMLLLLCCWVAMTVLGLTAMGVVESADIPAGDPARLLNGVDYRGRICGSDSAVESRPVLYPLTDYVSVCLSSCPSSATEDWCVSDDADVCGDLQPSVDILNYCVLREPAGNATTDGRKDPDAYEEVVADLWLASGYIGGFGFCVAMLFGFLYLRLLRVPGVVTTMVWGSIFFVLVVLYASGSTALDEAESWEAEEPQSHTDAYVNAMRALGYALYGVAFVFVMVIMYLRRRISLAVGVVKEASRAVSAMPTLVLLPVWQAAGLVIFLVPWLSYALYLASAGTIEGATVGGVGYKTIEYSTNVRWALFFHLFAWFWTSQFVLAIGEIIIAMAIATWYFTRNKSDISAATVAQAVRRSLFYHAGSAAFGSLVIALVKLLRAVLAYISAKCGKSTGKFAQFVMACISCCLWCVEKCLRFLNGMAYVLIAIYGDPFCVSCKKAFFLILRNVERIAAVAIVGEFVLLIGKVAITVCAAGAAYQAMAHTIDDELNGLIAPALMTMLLAFFTANMFTSVFGMGIDSLLLCYVCDEEMFEPSQRFAEGSLRKWVAATQAQAAETVEIGEVPASALPGGGLLGGSADGSGSGSGEGGEEMKEASGEYSF